MKTFTRRRFLLTAGAGGLAVAGLGTWLALRSREQGPLVRVGRKARAFGTQIELIALHADESAATAAVAAALAEVAAVERLMSLFRSDSELSRLNRDGLLDAPHPKLVEILRDAQSLGQRTRGAFDVTVGPLWQLYREAGQGGRLPDANRIDAARAMVDFARMDVTPSRIRLAEGMSVTLNSIAQGYAADRALAALRDRGIEHALVNTGEVAPLGRREDGARWSAGIQHPRVPDAFAAAIALDGRPLATSGDYATTFTGDFANHHIFDPATGRSPTELSSVSVLAPTAMAADALSTAALVLGPTRGLSLVGQTEGCDAMIIFKDGRRIATAGFAGGAA